MVEAKNVFKLEETLEAIEALMAVFSKALGYFLYPHPPSFFCFIVVNGTIGYSPAE